MLTIRLQRTGKKNQADFRIVLAEKTAPVSKRSLEILGSYNPRKKAFQVKNQERLQYWIAQKVELSPTVHNLLVTNKMLDLPKVRAFNTPKKPAEPVAVEAAAPAPAAEAPEAVSASAEAPAPAEEPKPEATAEPTPEKAA